MCDELVEADDASPPRPGRSCDLDERILACDEDIGESSVVRVAAPSATSAQYRVSAARGPARLNTMTSTVQSRASARNKSRR